MPEAIKSFIELDRREANSILNKFKAESFRLDQINNWIYDQGINDWGEMVNIPKDNNL